MVNLGIKMMDRGPMTVAYPCVLTCVFALKCHVFSDSFHLLRDAQTISFQKRWLFTRFILSGTWLKIDSLLNLKLGICWSSGCSLSGLGEILRGAECQSESCQPVCGWLAFGGSGVSRGSPR